MRRVLGTWIVMGALACGGDAETGTSASGSPFMPSATDGSATGGEPSTDATATEPGDPTDGPDTAPATDTSEVSSSGSESDPTEDPTMDPTMNPTGDPTLDPTDPPPPATPCDPVMALFEGRPLEASVELDGGTATCAVRRGNTADATLLFTVRPTGTLDVTAGAGVTMQNSSHGTYINEMAVTNIVTNVEVTVELTDADGMPASVEFTFNTTGPSLTSVGVRY